MEDFLKNPLHPYGSFLTESLPAESPYKRKKVLVHGELKTVRDEGCPFRFNCPYYDGRCETFPPKKVLDKHKKERAVWCWIYI
jgi:oligopeptide/dipeptide ABC transporter ATP-binding protein